MTAGIRIVQERRNMATFWTLEVIAGQLLATDIDDFIADLKTAITTVDQLNRKTKQRGQNQ